MLMYVPSLVQSFMGHFMRALFVLTTWIQMQVKMHNMYAVFEYNIGANELFKVQTKLCGLK